MQPIERKDKAIHFKITKSMRKAFRAKLKEKKLEQSAVLLALIQQFIDA